MSRRYFGTDGVRGPFGGPVVNVSFAARLGYADQAHFTHDFRAVTGMTPGEFLGDQQPH